MSSFTQFDASLKLMYVGKKQWRVIDGFCFYLKRDSQITITVPDGFLTDGATVPRLLHTVLPPWGEYGQAAVLHDYVLEERRYDTDPNTHITRDEARSIFNEAMKVVNVPHYKRIPILIGVFIWDKIKQLRGDK